MPFESLNDADSTVEILNEGTDEQLVCVGYQPSILKNVIFYFLTFITVGFPLLIFYWKPNWGVKCRQKKCSLSVASTVLLTDLHGYSQSVPVVSQRVTRSFPREFVYCPNDNLANTESGINNNFSVAVVNDRSSLTDNEGLLFRYFIYRKGKYYWNQSCSKFLKLRGYDSNTPCSDFYEKLNGLTVEQQAERGQLFGDNIIYVEVKSYFQLFIEEVLNPFYIFQIGSIILWCLDDYYYFASCIFVISAVSMALSLYEIKKQSKTLHDLASGTASVVTVIRKNGATDDVQSDLLVPGDIIIIPSRGCVMTCDAVITAGNCIVNESMLTGESVPVTKTPITYDDESEIYNPEKHKRHTLFCGTHVIQTRYYGNTNVTAVVIRTGFSTAKGELIRSILFPRPVGFKFYRDSMRFIIMLFFIAMMGMIYSLVIYIRAGFPVGKVIIRLLDIVTIVVPPALPAAMTVGSVYAQNRLKKQKIFCISPPAINICGKLKIICFDKTGTLTQEGLDLWGIVPVNEESKSFDHMVTEPSSLNSRSPFVVAMATCHSLTTIDGELVGDPLDLKMFESTKWVLEEPGQDSTRFDLLYPNVVRPSPLNIYSHFDLDFLTDSQIPYEIGIVRQFPFSSSLQRMSVITRTLGVDHMDLFVKGAPEKILSLCDPACVPENFQDRLDSYAVQGYRVIALAWKPLDSKITWHHVQRINRDEIEKDLIFLGFIIMQNMLKPETTPIIHQLKTANIRTVMITGDNLHTAICVARECGMISSLDKIIIINATPPDGTKPACFEMEYASKIMNSSGDSSLNDSIHGDVQSINELILNVEKTKFHFCLNGKSFAIISTYFPDFIDKIAVCGTVFARMSPDQKTQLVEQLQEIDYIVGMCGDGANDCGALKVANVGISLSEAEASVAAPFTSKNDNIRCVTTLIKEGRCALVTSFGVFKYMALYSMIQFISVLILYSFKTNLGDMQFLYIDLALATVMAVVMGYTEAFPEIVSKSPPGSLMKLSNVTSILFQILTVAVVQIGSILLLRSYSWYIQVSPEVHSKFTKCWETTVVFIVSSFQYLILAVAFSKGPPFRKPLYTNIPMVSAIIFFTIMNSIFLIYPFHWLARFFEINEFHLMDHIQFRVFISSFILANLIVSLLIEIFVESWLMKKITACLCFRKKPKKYKAIKREIESSNYWPIVGEIYYSSVTG